MTGSSGWLISEPRLLLAFNVAVGGLWISAAGLAAARLFRKRPPDLRRSFLLGTVFLLGLSPSIALVARHMGVGLLRVEGKATDLATPSADVILTGSTEGHTIPEKLSGRDGGSDPVADWPSVSRAAIDPTIAWAEPECEVKPFRIIGTVLIFVWIAGSVIVLCFEARGAIRLLRFLKTLSRDVTPRVRDAASRAARSLGLRRSPEVFVSASAAVPVFLPIPRRRIVFPPDLDGELGDEELEAVLLHEMSHASPGATWISVFRAWSTCLFPWCPPVHLLHRKLDDLAEEVADSAAFRVHGDGLPLARALVGIAARARRLTDPRLLGAVGMLDPKQRGLEARMERLLRGELPTPAKRSVKVIAPLALAFTAVIGFLGLMVRWTEAAPAEAGDGKAGKATAKPSSEVKASPEEKKLIEKLRSGKIEEVREAVQKLGEMKSVAAIGPILDLYVKSKAPKKDVDEKKAVQKLREARELSLLSYRAILMILRERGKGAMPELEKAIRGSSPEARKTACELLAGAVKTEGVEELLRKLEKDDSEEVRKAARKARESLEASRAKAGPQPERSLGGVTK